MPLRSLSTPLLVLAGALITTSVAAHGPTLRFPSAGAQPSDDEVAQLAFIHAHGCRALELTASERAAVTAAAAQVDDALADPAVVALIRAKTNWVVAAGDSWTRAAAIGAAVLTAWDAAEAVRVSVIAYDAGSDGPCTGAFGDAAIHAINIAGSRAILFNHGYLERVTHAIDPIAGRHELARTLAHEVAHVLGYTHQDAPDAVGLDAYNNTVPAFLGCVAESWPDLAYLATECGRADYARAPSPWRAACAVDSAPAAFAPGASVRVRFRERWLDGKVRKVDAARRRVEIDYGLAEAGSQWVDACRLQPCAHAGTDSER